MKKCENCGESFSVWTRINDKLHNLNNRRYCLEYSPFGAHNTRPFGHKYEPKEFKVCSACGNEKPISEFYKNGQYPHPECRKCFNKRSTEQQRKRKEQMVRLKGGKCSRCGYQGHIASFDFHHLDPKKKNFGIGNFKNRSLSNLQDELAKCILLCANCHRELEALGDAADWSFLR